MPPQAMRKIERFKMLVMLLDAESEAVRVRVREELVGYGKFLPCLVESMEEELTVEQHYGIHQVLTDYRQREMLSAWPDWLNVENPRQQLENALSDLCGLQVPEPLYPPLGELLDDLVFSFLKSGANSEPTDLARFLFNDYALKGAVHDYYNPMNSNLCYVLTEKRGIPITLACVMILVGARLGLSIEGVNLPGHFLARSYADDKMLIFDCFNKGRILKPRETAALFLSSAFDFRQLVGVAPSTFMIVSRVIQNMVYAYKKNELEEKALLFRRLLDQMHVCRREPPQDKGPGAKSGIKPIFKDGHLVRHKHYGYRGVVVDWDLSCQAGDSWYKSNRTQPDRDQPWYHVLVDGSDYTTYAAQSNLTADISGDEVRHPLLSYFFDGFKDGRYHRNETPWNLQ